MITHFLSQISFPPFVMITHFLSQTSFPSFLFFSENSSFYDPFVSIQNPSLNNLLTLTTNTLLYNLLTLAAKNHLIYNSSHIPFLSYVATFLKLGPVGYVCFIAIDLSLFHLHNTSTHSTPDCDCGTNPFIIKL